jgi:Fur family ferric uptake transcriptional regulator
MPMDVLRALDQAGHRLTEPRRTVASAIEARAGHFTAASILADARGRQPGIGRATVFRALDLFQDIGVVERIDLPSGVHAYVTCQPELHHHHVVCSRCGRTAEIDDRGIRAISRKIAKRTGYRIESHRMELFGTCPTCRKGRSPVTG